MKIEAAGKGLELEYSEEYGNNRWVWEELKKNGAVAITKVFHFETADLLNANRQNRLREV